MMVVLFGSAQQDPQYSMYMFNGLSINPAYSGSLGTLAASAMYRAQWVGVDGAPTTFVANAHQPFMDDKVGAGIGFTSDKIGVMNRNIISLMGSYHLKFPKFKVSFGLQGNMNQYHMGFSQVQTSSDGAVDNVFAQDLNQSVFNFGAGAFIYADKWFGGISAPQLIKSQITAFSGDIQKQSYAVPHMFLQGGYVYELNPMIDIKPSALVKYVKGSPVNVDLNVNVYYQKFIGVGLGFRNSKSIIAMLECQVHPYLKVAYAYDRGVSSMGTFYSSTHELMLRFMLTQKGVHVSPRLY